MSLDSYNGDVRTRFHLIAVAAILFIVSQAVAEPAVPEASPPPLRARMTGGFTAGFSGVYLGADPSVVWKPGTLAAGLGAQLITGLSQFDMYALPYARVEAGVLHLDIGYVAPLVRPLEGDELTGFVAGIGILPEPFALRFGRLGFDVAYDVNINGYVDGLAELADRSTFVQVVGSAMLAGRIGLGASYSFELF